MGDMLIRGVPEALKQEITEAAKTQDQSLSTKAIDLLRKGLQMEQEAKPAMNGWEMLRSVFEAHGPPDGEFAKVMEEIEAERKRDFGRPVDFDNGDDRK